MAKAIEPSTYHNGYYEPAHQTTTPQVEGHYQVPPSAEVLTSVAHNEFGLNVQRSWPTLHDGTNSPHPLPGWWRPSSEVDVLICGGELTTLLSNAVYAKILLAGPAGLQVAVSLARQGVSFRIIGEPSLMDSLDALNAILKMVADKAATPLIAGRADGVQPRFLEILHSWGLASEVHEEGPLIERTAIYKDGQKLFFGRSHQSDSRYRGLHIITQGQLERIYVRDLLRHQILVERSTVITDYSVDRSSVSDYSSHPIEATIRNEKTGSEKVVRAKYLIGSDGAGSMIRKRLGIPFEGISTDIYWGIMDCIFESDYPHAWVFGYVVPEYCNGYHFSEKVLKVCYLL